jgi:TatA/E family protein of Tat protein translocase
MSFLGLALPISNCCMNATFAMLNAPELIGLLALAVLIFGAKKIPEMARGLGQGIREFKKSLQAPPDESKTKMPNQS